MRTGSRGTEAEKSFFRAHPKVTSMGTVGGKANGARTTARTGRKGQERTKLEKWVLGLVWWGVSRSKPQSGCPERRAL